MLLPPTDARTSLLTTELLLPPLSGRGPFNDVEAGAVVLVLALVVTVEEEEGVVDAMPAQDCVAWVVVVSEIGGALFTMENDDTVDTGKALAPIWFTRAAAVKVCEEEEGKRLAMLDAADIDDPDGVWARELDERAETCGMGVGGGDSRMVPLLLEPPPEMPARATVAFHIVTSGADVCLNIRLSITKRRV